MSIYKASSDFARKFVWSSGIAGCHKGELFLQTYRAIALRDISRNQTSFLAVDVEVLGVEVVAVCVVDASLLTEIRRKTCRKFLL